MNYERVIEIEGEFAYLASNLNVNRSIFLSDCCFTIEKEELDNWIYNNGLNLITQNFIGESNTFIMQGNEVIGRCWTSKLEMNFAKKFI